MALHTKSDFARLCGITPGNLSNYIKRRNVVLSGDYVDDSVPQNAIFLNKWLAKKQEKESGQETTITEEKPKKIEEKIKEQLGAKVDTRIYSEPNVLTGKNKKIAGPAELNNYFQIEAQLKAQELEKKKAETEKIQLQVMKMQGETIPTDLFIQIFKQHNQSIATAIKDSIIDMLSIMTKEMGLNESNQSIAKGKFVELTNSVISKSMNLTKAATKQITENYEQKLLASKQEEED